MLPMPSGALEARNIAWLAHDFWDEIRPRSQQELVAFFRFLEEHTARPTDDSWKTPWERGASGTDVTSHETRELEISMNYLSTL